MSSSRKEILIELRGIHNELAAMRATREGITHMFVGIKRGKLLLIGTDALIWSGYLQQIETDYIVLSNATAIRTGTADQFPFAARLFVQIPLLKIAWVAIGEVENNPTKQSFWRRLAGYFSQPDVLGSGSD